MMQKNKTGLVFAGVYGICALIAIYITVTGGELSGISLIIVSLPWLLIIEPLMYLLSNISVQDLASVLEILSVAISIAVNIVVFYYIGKFLSKLWNRSTVQ